VARGALSLRSFRALRPGGRLVIFGHYSTLSHGRKSWRGWVEWYGSTASVGLWGLLWPGRRVFAYRIQKLRDRHQVLPVGGGHRNPEWFREDFLAPIELLRAVRAATTSATDAAMVLH
jgi:NADPH2:quinone reductase